MCFKYIELQSQAKLHILRATFNQWRIGEESSVLRTESKKGEKETKGGRKGTKKTRQPLICKFTWPRSQSSSYVIPLGTFSSNCRAFKYPRYFLRFLGGWSEVSGRFVNDTCITLDKCKALWIQGQNILKTARSVPSKGCYCGMWETLV